MFLDKYAFFFKNKLMKLFDSTMQMNICMKNKKIKKKIRTTVFLYLYA